MIQFGNDKIKEIYVGSDKIKEVYHGSDLVWKIKPSYAMTDNTRIDFEMENTPISNFCTTGDNRSSITVNGTSIVKNTIKEIVFGGSYSGVTSINDNFLRSLINLDSLDLSSLNNITTVGSDFLSSTNLPSYDLNHLIPLNNVTEIGDYFMYDCLAVTSIDLSPLSKLTSIPNNFLRGCTKLTSVDFSSLSNVTSIGNYFLANCTNLTQFKIGAVNVPSTSESGFLQYTLKLITILVPMQSVQAYKTRSPWSNHASKITGY